MSLIQLDNISKTYGAQTVLNSITFKVETGKQLVIQGASGSGKSTLLYLLGGLETPSRGKLFVDNKDLQDLSDADLAEFRNSVIGFVFQFHFLLPSMNCLENILLPSRIGGKFSDVIEERVLLLSEKLGITNLLKKFPFEISGGEQQRVNIVRALSLRPKLLLCDEPTGNLDSKNSALVTHLIRDLAEEFEATLIVVTHDKEVASQFHERHIMLDGQLQS